MRQKILGATVDQKEKLLKVAFEPIIKFPKQFLKTLFFGYFFTRFKEFVKLWFCRMLICSACVDIFLPHT
jgi:hypothetical protein